MLISDFGKKKQIIPLSPELNFINTLKKSGNKRRKEMMSKARFKRRAKVVPN